MPDPNHRIWIDLDNSPHVPFFKAIIPRLEARGFEVRLTARDAYQVCELVEQAGMNAHRIGHHYGKNKILKTYGTLYRTLQLIPFARRFRPAIALSHGSRSQLMAGRLLRIPIVQMGDYEHGADVPGFASNWQIVPEVISHHADSPPGRSRELTYPGIKEDIYVPDFQPDDSIRAELGIAPESILVTIRPPATTAHYHNPEAEALFDASMDLLLENPQTQLIILPRTDDQRDDICRRWEVTPRGGRVIIPEHVVDGLNLIWFSDFVISGGGTMNREAAALGVPVYSIFRGKTGGVDRYLSETGRLIMLESPEDVQERIDVRKQPPRDWASPDPGVLDCVVEHIAQVMESYSSSAESRGSWA